MGLFSTDPRPAQVPMSVPGTKRLRPKYTIIYKIYLKTPQYGHARPQRPEAVTMSKEPFRGTLKSLDKARLFIHAPRLNTFVIQVQNLNQSQAKFVSHITEMDQWCFEDNADRHLSVKKI